MITLLREEMENVVKESRESIEIKIEAEIGDKVKVDEVQDALRRLTDSYNGKLENIYGDVIKTVSAKSEENYGVSAKLKGEIQELSSLINSKVTQ